ncbi:MAG: threonine synthase [Acidimicrobiales bacterium]
MRSAVSFGSLPPRPEMRYQSTRGDAPILNFSEALLAGLASDGGLYVPMGRPRLEPDLGHYADRPYAEVAAEVIALYAAPSIEVDTLNELTARAYSTFRHEDVVPLRELGNGEYLLELFWGPTLAFKDVALQLLGQLFSYELERRGQSITIVGATSGDTGSAAIEACRDRDGIHLIMLHPKGRVSDVQRRQMTTVQSRNIHNVAIDGTFDDCQDLVKELFADHAFRADMRLSAVNSINWARIVAQIVYYITAAAKFGGSPVSFSVPTGNFANVLAGHMARSMGLPIEQLIIGSNRNNILSRFFNSGVMQIEGVEPSVSPAMDIQISSNFERVLFEAMDEVGHDVAEAMREFRATGMLPITSRTFSVLRGHFDAATLSDDQTKAVIAAVFAEHGLLVDPHTAVGLGAGRQMRRATGTPLISLACAHPAKFADTVFDATGVVPELPGFLVDLHQRDERCDELANSPADLKRYVSEVAG